MTDHDAAQAPEVAAVQTLGSVLVDLVRTLLARHQQRLRELLEVVRS